MKDFSDLRGDVVGGAKKIFKAGLVEAGEGNVSARLPGKDELLITPTFNDYDGLREEDVVHIKFDGTRVSGKREPSAEYRLHARVYQAKPKANYAIHTHSPYATMLSVARYGIPPILEEMLVFLGGCIPVSEYGQANTEELPEKAVKALRGRNAVLLANHGSLACGRDIKAAVKVAEVTEKMARVYWGVLQAGEPHEIPVQKHKMFLDKFERNFSTE